MYCGDETVGLYESLLREWNPHPVGPCGRVLHGAHRYARDGLCKLIMLLISVLEPCFGYDLSIREL